MKDITRTLLSIIVPVYNVEEYLEECLDSLVIQDISHDEYEIICVDDGSTDKSGKILDLYAENYTNIVVVHKENGGVSSARNCGIDIAKGQYIWFVDSDDLIKDNCLATIKQKIIEDKYDTIRVLAYSFNHGDNKLPLNNVSTDMCQRGIKNFLWTYIIKREHIVKNAIYLDTKIVYAEDAIYMLQLAPFLKKSITIKDVVVYFYRQRPGSAMSYNLNKKIRSRIDGALACDEIINGERVGDIESAYYYKYISIVKIMEMAFKLSRAERNEIVKELKNKNLFPLKYSSKYTPNFRKNKTNFTKKAIKVLCDFSYTRIGYFLLCCFVDIKSLLKQIIDKVKIEQKEEI